MNKDDLDLVLHWRNSPNVRLNMLSNHVISNEEHGEWFQNKSQDESHRLLVTLKNQIRFGFVQIKLNHDKTIGEWGFYCDPARHIGSGMELAKLALDYAFLDLNLQELWGIVIKDNTRSIEFHKKNGFSIFVPKDDRDLKFINNSNIYKYYLRNDMWKNRKIDYDY